MPLTLGEVFQATRFGYLVPKTWLASAGRCGQWLRQIGFRLWEPRHSTDSGAVSHGELTSDPSQLVTLYENVTLTDPYSTEKVR